MAVPSSLDLAQLNLQSIREDTTHSLTKFLSSLAATRIALVIDPEIYDLLPHVIIDQTATLNRYGVDAADMQVLDKGKLEAQTLHHNDVVVFMARPSIRIANEIASQVLRLQRLDTKKRFAVLFTPRSTETCRQVFIERRVERRIKTCSFDMDLIPVFDDVLSLEMSNAWADCKIHNDFSSLFDVTRALMKLQSSFGVIPNVHAKGDMAKIVVDMLLRERKEAANDDLYQSTAPEIDTLIILDRDVDYVTPLVTPVTCEALLDLQYSIKQNSVSVPQQIIGDLAQKPKSSAAATAASASEFEDNNVIISLDSTSRIYRSIRNEHYSVAGMLLHEHTKYFTAVEEKKNRPEIAVPELKELLDELKVKGLREKTELQIFINLLLPVKEMANSLSFRRKWTLQRDMQYGNLRDADMRKEMMNLIFSRAPLWEVFRTICLYSELSGGLDKDLLKKWRQDIIATYGFAYALGLENLIQAGLIRLKGGNACWNKIKGTLNLLEDVQTESLRDPESISYVTQGYAPITCRLIEQALCPSGWKGISAALRHIPGKTVSLQQPASYAGGVATAATGRPDAAASEESDERKLILLLFLGGISFAEVAAIRLISKRSNYDFVIVTTSIVNSETMLSAFMPEVQSTIMIGSADRLQTGVSVDSDDDFRP